ncbi:RNase A-like domain-containing protein [Actinophytocola sediminis]
MQINSGQLVDRARRLDFLADVLTEETLTSVLAEGCRLCGDRLPGEPAEVAFLAESFDAAGVRIRRHGADVILVGRSGLPMSWHGVAAEAAATCVTTVGQGVDEDRDRFHFVATLLRDMSDELRLAGAVHADVRQRMVAFQYEPATPELVPLVASCLRDAAHVLRDADIIDTNTGDGLARLIDTPERTMLNVVVPSTPSVIPAVPGWFDPNNPWESILPHVDPAEVTALHQLLAELGQVQVPAPQIPPGLWEKIWTGFKDLILKYWWLVPVLGALWALWNIVGPGGSSGGSGRYQVDFSKDPSWNTHIKRDHVNVSDDKLWDRLVADPLIDGASTFSDEATAQEAIQKAIDQHRRDIDAWIKLCQRYPNSAAAERPWSLPDTEFPDPIGWGLSRDDYHHQEKVPQNYYRVRVTLVFVPPAGFRLVTAFPTY